MPDLLLAFWSQILYTANRHFVPVPPYIPQIPHQISDPVFLKYWGLVASWTMSDIYRAKQIWDLALEAKDLEGDFIECGCHRGGISFLLAFLLRHYGVAKRVILCDSFAGLPATDPQRDLIFREGTLVSDRGPCEQFIQAHDLSAYTDIQAGWFADTLPTLPPAQRLALLHFDGDLYQSTVTCYQELYPRAVDRAPIILDDYNLFSPGVRLATREYLANTRERLEMGPLPQAYFRKGQGPALAPADGVRDPEGTIISIAALRHNDAYAHFLTAVAAHYQQQTDNLQQVAQQIQGPA